MFCKLDIFRSLGREAKSRLMDTGKFFDPIVLEEEDAETEVEEGDDIVLLPKDETGYQEELEKVNEDFGDHIVTEDEEGFIIIHPSDELVDAYWSVNQDENPVEFISVPGLPTIVPTCN